MGIRFPTDPVYRFRGRKPTLLDTEAGRCIARPSECASPYRAAGGHTAFVLRNPLCRFTGFLTGSTNHGASEVVIGPVSEHVRRRLDRKLGSIGVQRRVINNLSLELVPKLSLVGQ
jgi:hypothetical protein